MSTKRNYRKFSAKQRVEIVFGAGQMSCCCYDLGT